MSDALERLKKRNRPTVPSRDASLVPTTDISITPDTSLPASLDTSIPRNQETEDSDSLESQESKPLLETKQSTLRLERSISDRLQDLCREQGICREVLIEAMFEYCQANTEALQAVLPAARKKNEQRQLIANHKRAKSMMQRFG